jgi:prophage antirepressor-like protein
MIDKKYRKALRDIETSQEIDRTQPNTIYITENGLYKLLIKSKMKMAEKFQEWLVEDVLPKLRQHGKYELDTNTQAKIKERAKKNL